MKLMNFIKKFNREESGQDLVEYALVLVAVGTGAFTASTTLSGDIAGAIASLQGKIDTWMNPA